MNLNDLPFRTNPYRELFTLGQIRPFAIYMFSCLIKRGNLLKVGWEKLDLHISKTSLFGGGETMNGELLEKLAMGFKKWICC